MTVHRRLCVLGPGRLLCPDALCFRNHEHCSLSSHWLQVAPHNGIRPKQLSLLHTVTQTICLSYYILETLLQLERKQYIILALSSANASPIHMMFEWKKCATQLWADEKLASNTEKFSARMIPLHKSLWCNDHWSFLRWYITDIPFNFLFKPQTAPKMANFPYFLLILRCSTPLSKTFQLLPFWNSETGKLNKNSHNIWNRVPTLLILRRSIHVLV